MLTHGKFEIVFCFFVRIHPPPSVHESKKIYHTTEYYYTVDDTILSNTIYTEYRSSTVPISLNVRHTRLQMNPSVICVARVCICKYISRATRWQSELISNGWPRDRVGRAAHDNFVTSTHQIRKKQKRRNCKYTGVSRTD